MKRKTHRKGRTLHCAEYPWENSKGRSITTRKEKQWRKRIEEGREGSKERERRKGESKKERKQRGGRRGSREGKEMGKRIEEGREKEK